MAYMIPPYFCEDTSSGERQIFDRLKDAPESDDWTCLHSLAISKHSEKVYGEIDFVLLIPNHGVFCLEVKSGRVSRKNGVWEYKNQSDQVFKDPVGPIGQVNSACYSLMKSVKDQFGPKHPLWKVIFHWGIMFPDCEFKHQGTECEDWQIYNKKDKQRPINDFIINLAQQTHEKMKNQPWYHPKHSRPSGQAIKELIWFLRGDFEFCVKKGSEASELQEEILKFTSEQVRCLESLRGNRRCFFTGAAGTGKTVLAVEFAKREATRGDRLLFVCYNKLLANKLKMELSDFSDRITVDYFLDHLEQIVLKSPLKEEFVAIKSKVDSGNNSGEKDQFYTKTVPDYAELALTDRRELEFDLLIVDEAQDLIRSRFLDLMDYLLRGGLGSGRWVLFGDLFGQKIFSDLTAEEMKAEINTRSPYHTQFSLMVNCRNTRNIGKDTCKLAGFDEPPFLTSSVTGPPVDYKYYAEVSEVPKILGELVRKLAAEGIQRESITILSGRTFVNSFPDTPTNKFRFKLCDITKDPKGSEKDAVIFATIQAFKGLESPVVIMIGMNDLESDRAKDLLYVAMSRAIIRLFMVLPVSLENRVKDILKS
jgi:hypothetical protein